jgi:hypothetical protein
LINKFNAANAFVVPAEGQSGGLWLLWKDNISLSVVDQAKYYIFALCTNHLDNMQFGLVCVYGDPHHHDTHLIWDQVTNFVVSNSGLPILCTGDMNELMHAHEKSGLGRPDRRRIETFCNYVNQCGFVDLSYSGPAYTWSNKRRDCTTTFEWLDHSLANAEWCHAYPNTIVYHLPMLRSDHAPILTLLSSSRQRTNKPFRFENWWLFEQDYEQTAKTSWLRSANRTFQQKTKFLARDLKKWRQRKPKLSYQLLGIEDSILKEQLKPPNEQDFNIQHQLSMQHQ